MHIKWIKCKDNKWCDLFKLNLEHDHFQDLKGVYIIFSGEKQAVRIGSGIIGNRLREHRENQEIANHSNLRVTWAQVNANQMEGVEAFLADELHPLTGERFPRRTKILVNLPW